MEDLVIYGHWLERLNITWRQATAFLTYPPRAQVLQKSRQIAPEMEVWWMHRGREVVCASEIRWNRRGDLVMKRVGTRSAWGRGRLGEIRGEFEEMCARFGRREEIWSRKWVKYVKGKFNFPGETEDEDEDDEASWLLKCRLRRVPKKVTPGPSSADEDESNDD
jgi:hypothetical protein